jgi:hypothetical protein
MAPHRSSTESSSGHIKRPVNCFMIWACEERQKFYKYSKIITNNSQTSKMLGEIWNSMSDEDKQKYKDMADKINKEHKQKHPYYKYNPKRRDNKYKEKQDKKEKKEKKDNKENVVKIRKISITNTKTKAKTKMLSESALRFIKAIKDINIDIEEPDYFTELQSFYKDINLKDDVMEYDEPCCFTDFNMNYEILDYDL